MSATLNKITARAKQIRKKHPAMKWTSAIKAASVQLKKSGAIGTTKKKPAAKKKVARKKATRTKKALRQTGSSNKFYDEQRTAKPPGKRKSRAGKTYYETRKNRSDMPGTLTGVSHANLLRQLKSQLEDMLGRAFVKRERATTKREKREWQKKITDLKRRINKLK